MEKDIFMCQQKTKKTPTKKIIQISKSNDYATGNLLDYK